MPGIRESRAIRAWALRATLESREIPASGNRGTQEFREIPGLPPLWPGIPGSRAIPELDRKETRASKGIRESVPKAIPESRGIRGLTRM